MHFHSQLAALCLLIPAGYCIQQSAEAVRGDSPTSESRRWTNAREYELGRRATEQFMPAQQIQALIEWETAFPKSDFDRERSLLFIDAYRKSGRWSDAFARAARGFRLHPSEVSEAIMVADLAVLLPSPTADQVAVTKEAAGLLLAHAAETGRAIAAEASAARNSSPGGTADPETQILLKMIRTWRQGKHIRTAAEVEMEIRQRAEKALEWARSH